MPAVWATALAAAGAYVRRLLLLHAPGTHQLLAALYSALPRGTTTVLTTIFSGLVATLAVLLLRPRVLRAGVKNVVPFLAVAGSTALAVLVPLAIGLAITSLGLLSFGPMVMAYLAGRWLLLSVTTRLLLASILPLGVLLWSLALYQIVRRNGREGMWQLLWQGTHTLRIYMSFLLPFYTPFAILLVGAFSLVWGASIGAFMFIQGEVFADWSGAARRRWPGMLALCELLFAVSVPPSRLCALLSALVQAVCSGCRLLRSIEPRTSLTAPCVCSSLCAASHASQGAVFDYFPITVRRGTTALRLATGDEPPLRSDRRYLFCYHPHGVYAFGLFALLFGKRSRFHQLFQQPPRSNRSTNECSGSGRSGQGDRASRSPSPSSSTGGRRRATTSPSPSPPLPPPPQQQRGMLIGVANALLHVPMVCTFLSWFGFIPVAPGCLAEACSSQHNVSLVPGGIAEMTAYQGGSMLCYAISSARFCSENLELTTTSHAAQAIGRRVTITIIA